MILVRLCLIALAIGGIVGAASGMAHLMPCPSIQPPPGLTADFFAVWSSVIFLACLVYVAIPLVNFQIWGALLGPALGLGFAVAFAQSGEWRFALFLAIQCAITIGLSLAFNAIATALAEVFQWHPWVLKIIALPLAYTAATGWGYVQAIGFSQSLC